MKLVDIWQIFNSSGNEYSFQSEVHNLYAGTDFFLVEGKLLPFSLNSKCRHIVISDHRRMSFTLRPSENMTNHWLQMLEI